MKSRSKIAFFFSSERHFEIWFPKRKTIIFSEETYLNNTKKTNKQTHTHTQYFACDVYIFPKTRGNKNKQWTHLCALKRHIHTPPTHTPYPHPHPQSERKKYDNINEDLSACSYFLWRCAPNNSKTILEDIWVLMS